MLEKKPQIFTDSAFSIIKSCPNNIFLLQSHFHNCHVYLSMLSWVSCPRWHMNIPLSHWHTTTNLPFAISHFWRKHSHLKSIPLSHLPHVLTCQTLLIPPHRFFGTNFLPSFLLPFCTIPHYFLPCYNNNIIIMGMSPTSPSKQFCDDRM